MKRYSKEFKDSTVQLIINKKEKCRDNYSFKYIIFDS